MPSLTTKHPSNRSPARPKITRRASWRSSRSVPRSLRAGSMTISTIGILGSGTMGGGIAQVAAVSGFNVLLYDVSAGALQKAVERIKDDLNRGVGKSRL